MFKGETNVTVLIFFKIEALQIKTVIKIKTVICAGHVEVLEIKVAM